MRHVFIVVYAAIASVNAAVTNVTRIAELEKELAALRAGPIAPGCVCGVAVRADDHAPDALSRGRRLAL